MISSNHLRNYQSYQNFFLGHQSYQIFASSYQSYQTNFHKVTKQVTRGPTQFTRSEMCNYLLHSGAILLIYEELFKLFKWEMIKNSIQKS